MTHIDHVYVSDRTKQQHRVLQDVSFSADPGCFVSIVGPSGCGKSTMLSLISGLARPAAGQITVSGEPVRGVRRDVGFIFQRDALLPWRTAQENIELALKYRKVPKAERKQRADFWIEKLGLTELTERYPREMSGGQRKRVAIAATLTYEPKLLLMDEPFSALDVQTRDAIENDVLDVWSAASDQTIIFVTHDLEEAIGMSDRVVVMSRGPGRVVGDYKIDLPRPRDLMEIRTTERFRELHQKIWEALRYEVLAADAAVKAARSK